MRIIQSLYERSTKFFNYIYRHRKHFKVIISILLILGIILVYHSVQKKDEAGLSHFNMEKQIFDHMEKTNKLKGTDTLTESDDKNISEKKMLADDIGKKETKEVDRPIDICCDISGSIKRPGVYILSAGSRLQDLIEKSGGLKEEADIDSINRARILSDGEKVYIPSRTENLPPIMTENGSAGSKKYNNENPIIDINSADRETLQEIPGIGPVTADKIIEYRENEGAFSSIEEIKNISGIGEKKFEKIKKFIKV